MTVFYCSSKVTIFGKSSDNFWQKWQFLVFKGNNHAKAFKFATFFKFFWKKLGSQTSMRDFFYLPVFLIFLKLFSDLKNSVEKIKEWVYLQSCMWKYSDYNGHGWEWDRRCLRTSCGQGVCGTDGAWHPERLGGGKEIWHSQEYGWF